jgi:alpha-beta hydrolase superfamily lysophospholipase
MEAVEETVEMPAPSPETRAVTFTSQEFALEGVLHLPESAEGAPLVVGVHGLFSSVDSPKQIALAEACARHGIGFLRFSHRGCGNSEGEFGQVTTLEARRADLADAVAAARREAPFGPKLGLFGSSLGGTVCLSMARALHADAVVTLAAPLRSDIIRQVVEPGDPAENDLPDYDPAALAFDVREAAAGVSNILILHGDSDKVVTPSEAFRVYQLAAMPKRIIMFRDGDHRLSLQENQEKFQRETVNWFRGTLSGRISADD